MKRKNEAGQALVFAAVGLVVLMGFAGLGIDMGMLRYQKRLQQTAADAGALAGANNLGKGGVTAGAQNASSLNGFTNGANNATVTVNNPPASGPHAGNANYVEVLVTDVQPTYFMKILGINSQTITARAVGTNLSGATTANGCLYTLGPPSSAIEGVNINGHATLNAITCGIADNGNFNTAGQALTVCAATFGVAGTSSDTGSSGSTCTNKAVTCSAQAGPCPATGMPAATDPMSLLTPPLTPPCSPCSGGSAISIDGNGNFTGSGVTYSNGVYTVSPGTYSSITIRGTGSGNTVVFSSGTYIIDGAAGLTIPGNATISGTGVTFYFTGSATINMTGTPSIQLTPPSSGQYAGILMYQDPADTNTTGPSLGGNSGSNFGGLLYFPKDQLTFFGNNTSYSAGIVIADSLALSGNPTVNLQGAADMPPGVNIISNATLVE
jgi:hypothetical protein